MAVVKITEKAVAESVLDNAHILITQEEDIDGEPTEALRRATLEGLLAAFGLGTNNGALCAVTEV